MESVEQPPPTKPKQGGKRPGAGRKKGSTLEKLGAYRHVTASMPAPKVRSSFAAYYRDQVSAHLAPLTAQAIRMALAGDSRMLIDTLDRYLGRAPQSLEVSGPQGGPIRLQQVSLIALAQLSADQIAALDTLAQRLTPDTPQPVLDVAAVVVDPDTPPPEE